jgi:hypothetical protein
MHHYEVTLPDGTVIQHDAKNITEARTWAKKVHKVKRPQDVTRRRKYVLCPKCDCKPCCC